MSTPFDAAVKILRRRTDEIQMSISNAADRLGDIKLARDRLTSLKRSEAALAASHWELPSAAYMNRLGQAHERLSADEQRCEAELAALQDAALESYASLKAVESAAHDFTVEADRAVDVAQQSTFDDITSTRYARDIRLMRKVQQRFHAS